MARNMAYRNKPCGYCGVNTGPEGEGDHVIPYSFYPRGTDPRVQRLKIPSCPKCNDLWERDEGLFVAVMTLCGLRETPERSELWAKSLRSFERPIGGKKDLWAIASQLVPHSILRSDGKPYQQLFPCKNPRIVAVLKKILRGLAHFHRGEIISDRRVGITHEPFPLFDELCATLTTVYTVPHVFTGRSLFSDEPEVAGWHSLWVLDFLDNVRLFGWITGKGDLVEDPVPYHLA
jgi:hypothetical protein